MFIVQVPVFSLVNPLSSIKWISSKSRANFSKEKKKTKKTIVPYTLVHEFYLNEGVMFSTSCTNCFLFQDKKELQRLSSVHSNFRKFYLSLAASNSIRVDYLRDDYQEEYGPEFHSSLTRLTNKFLSKIDDHLPLTMFEKVCFFCFIIQNLHLVIYLPSLDVYNSHFLHLALDKIL